jgi:pyochelin biosynthetic protein PchC
MSDDIGPWVHKFKAAPGNAVPGDRIRRRADYRAVRAYRSDAGREPRLGCRITAMAGDADPRVSARGAEGRCEHTSGTFELRSFSGGHFCLDQNLPGVVSCVRSELLGEVRV